MPYTITRYANRKLYDPQASRYVTLEEVAQLIREGQDIRVRDATSGDDVTAVVLAQVILEETRAGAAALPAALLQQLIKHGEAWQSVLQESLRASLAGVVTSQRDLERIYRAWLARAGFPPAAPPSAPRSRPAAPSAGSRSAVPSPEDLRRDVAALRRQVQALERRLRGKPARRRAKRSRRAKR